MEVGQYDRMYIQEDTHWWFLAKRAFLSSIFPSVTGRTQILDIGSGTGGMSSFLKRYGDVTCVEPSPEAIRFLKKRKLHICPKAVSSCNFSRGSFDVVTIIDVLYHRNIRSDERVLSKVYAWLKPGGRVIITDCAMPGFFGYHDRVMHARQRYALGEMVNKIEKQGFVIERASYIFFMTFPLFAATRFFENIFRIYSVKEVNPLVNAVLLTLCRLESRMLQVVNLPIGSSLIIRARKPPDEFRGGAEYSRGA